MIESRPMISIDPHARRVTKRYRPQAKGLSITGYKRWGSGSGGCLAQRQLHNLREECKAGMICARIPHRPPNQFAVFTLGVRLRRHRTLRRAQLRILHVHYASSIVLSNDALVLSSVWLLTHCPALAPDSELRCPVAFRRTAANTADV